MTSSGLPRSSDHLSSWLPQVLPPEPNTPGSIPQHHWEDAVMVLLLLDRPAGEATQTQSCGLPHNSGSICHRPEKHSLSLPCKIRLSQSISVPWTSWPGHSRALQGKYGTGSVDKFCMALLLLQCRSELSSRAQVLEWLKSLERNPVGSNCISISMSGSMPSGMT